MQNPMSTISCHTGAKIDFSIPKNTIYSPKQLTYEASTSTDNSPIPSWISFDKNFKKFNGLCPKKSGMISIAISVNDGYNQEISNNFDIYIENFLPEVVQSIEQQNIQLGKQFELNLPSNLFLDRDKDPLNKSATIFS